MDRRWRKKAGMWLLIVCLIWLVPVTAWAGPASAGEKITVPSDLSGISPGTLINPSSLRYDELGRYFTAKDIVEGDAIYRRIIGKSYVKNEDIGLEDLSYLKLLHYNFQGEIQVGELIVNKGIRDDVLAVFEELFREKYQIHSMYLIDDFWTGDPNDSDTESIDHNNTSAFCYRPMTGSGKLSNHAYGRAIDLNPRQNPYVRYVNGKPQWVHKNADQYIDRETGRPHMITHEDLAYRLFAERGFQWGGDWKNIKDYQHFEKEAEPEEEKRPE